MKQVGKVTHYYGKLGVAIVELTGKLKKGDTIKIADSSGEFEETVAEMQVDHKEVAEAKKGDAVGIKVSRKVHEGAAVYLP